MVLRKKNDLLSQENEVLREKIQILQKTLEQKKEQILAQNLHDNGNSRDYNERVNIINKIGDLETEKIELEEVLRKEIIKNEKLESMVDLLKKINEEKLEVAGMIPYQNKTRVETVIDAAHIFDENSSLREQSGAKNQEIAGLHKEIENMKEMVANLNKKNEQLIHFKFDSDKKLIQQKKQELQYSKALDHLREEAELINVQLNAEKRRKKNLDTQLSTCREAMGVFVNSADDISEVMSYLANDLLL